MSGQSDQKTLYLRVDAKGAIKEVVAFGKRLENVASQVVKQGEAFKGTTADIAKYRNETKKAGEQAAAGLAKASERVSELAAKFRAVRHTVKEYGAQVREATRETTRLAKENERLQRQIDRTNTRMAAMQAQMVRNSGLFGSFGDSMRSFGRTMQSILAASLLYGVYTGIRSLVEQARAFEIAMVGVAKTTGMASGELEHLKAKVQDISVYYGNARDHVAEITRLGGQLGIRGIEDLGTFTEVVTQLELATNLTSEVAATSLARVLKLTGEKVEDSAERLANAFVTLGNNFAAIETEIATRTLDLAPVLGRFKYPSDVVAAYGTAAALSQVQSQSLATALNKLLIGLDTIAGNINDHSEGMKVLVTLMDQSPAEIRERILARDPDFMTTLIDNLQHFSPVSQQEMLQQLGLSDVRTQKALYAIMRLIRETYDVGVGARLGDEIGQEVERRREATYNRMDVAMQRMANRLDKYGMGLFHLLTMTMELLSAVVVIIDEIVQFVWLAVKPFLLLVQGFGVVVIAWEALKIIGPLMLQLVNIVWQLAKLPFSLLNAGISAAIGTVGLLFELVASVADHFLGNLWEKTVSALERGLETTNRWLNNLSFYLKGGWLNDTTGLGPVSVEEYRDYAKMPVSHLRMLEEQGQLPEGWVDRMLVQPPDTPDPGPTLQAMQERFVMMEETAKAFREMAPDWMQAIMPGAFEYSEEAANWVASQKRNKNKSVIPYLEMEHEINELLKDAPPAVRRTLHGATYSEDILTYLRNLKEDTEVSITEQAEINRLAEEYMKVVPGWMKLKLPKGFAYTEQARAHLKDLKEDTETDIVAQLKLEREIDQLVRLYAPDFFAGAIKGYGGSLYTEELRDWLKEHSQKDMVTVTDALDTAYYASEFLKRVDKDLQGRLPVGFEKTPAAATYVKQLMAGEKNRGQEVLDAAKLAQSIDRLWWLAPEWLQIGVENRAYSKYSDEVLDHLEGLFDDMKVRLEDYGRIFEAARKFDELLPATVAYNLPAGYKYSDEWADWVDQQEQANQQEPLVSQMLRDRELSGLWRDAPDWVTANTTKAMWDTPEGVADLKDLMGVRETSPRAMAERAQDVNRFFELVPEAVMKHLPAMFAFTDQARALIPQLEQEAGKESPYERAIRLAGAEEFLQKFPYQDEMPAGFEQTPGAREWLAGLLESTATTVEDIVAWTKMMQRQHQGYSHGYQWVNNAAVAQAIEDQEGFQEAEDARLRMEESERIEKELYEAKKERERAAVEKVRQTKEAILNHWREVSHGIAESLSALATGAQGLKDIFISIITQIRDALVKQFITQPLADGIGASVTRFITGSFFGTPGSVGPAGGPIPGLAVGGTVTAPGLALVGERGPEVLALPRAAQVIPLNKAGGDQIVINYNITGVQDPGVVEAVLDKKMPQMMDTFEAVITERTQGNGRFAQALNG